MLKFDFLTLLASEFIESLRRICGTLDGMDVSIHCTAKGAE